MWHQKNKNLLKKTKQQESVCAHCGSCFASNHSSLSPDPVFCCLGCETVYQLLHNTGLAHYYELQKTSRWIRKPQPANLKSENFSYLEDPEFLKNYSTAEQRCMDFYLEGVHCVACLWLIEKLPQLVNGVEKAELDLGKSIAKIKISENGSFSLVAEKLSRFGYRPHPIKQDEEAFNLQQKENRKMLVRIGVAGACTGNIMLMAVPLYGGVTGAFAELFGALSFVLFLPILLYCSIPFYKSALASIRSKALSIDVPIVFALVFGFIASTVYLIQGKEHLYYDSLAALIFLLLSSRYVLNRIQQRMLQSSHLLHFLTPSLAKRWNESSQKWEEQRSESLKAGDIIYVDAGEAIPADGKVKYGTSYINNSLLTGESVPQKVIAGDLVFSGTVNQDCPLHIEILFSGYQTRLGSILKEIEGGHLKKSPIVAWADQLSKWFVMGVLLLSLSVILFYFKSDVNLGLTRALALLIVTCPCALALATPLAMSVSLKKAGQAGILIKGAETLERLGRVKSVVLDKTGTLTEGRFEVLSWIEEAVPHLPLKEIVVALESRSQHPIAQALVRYIKPKTNSKIPEVREFKENLGHGVSGFIHNDYYEIGAIHKPSGDENSKIFGTRIGVWRNGQLIAQSILGDKIRRDSKSAIQRLKELNLNVFILSGDSREVVDRVGADLGIPPYQCLAQANPETKSEILKNQPHSLMVGDGANDAMALSTAFVGAAVHQSMEVSLRAADVYLSEAGVMPVIHVIEAGRETMKVIRRNFIFSILYNMAGASAAIFGFVNPLFAAILMPLSSLTVLSSSLIGTKKMRKYGRNNR